MPVKILSLLAIFRIFIIVLPFGTEVYASAVCKDGEHIFQTDIIDATDTEPGRISYICEICGYTYSEDIPPYGHHFSVTTKDPDCENPGKRTYTCVVCGYSYEEAFGEALGHVFDSSIEKEPTETEEGILVTEESSKPISTEAKNTASKNTTQARNTTSKSNAETLDTTLKNTKGNAEPFAANRNNSINFVDIMIGSLEIIILIVLLPGIYTCNKLIMWNKKRTDEFRKHHTKWKEIA